MRRLCRDRKGSQRVGIVRLPFSLIDQADQAESSLTSVGFLLGAEKDEANFAIGILYRAI